jgi:hypothetical protein
MVPEERGSAEENMFMNEATFLPSFYEIIILWHQPERKCGFLALNINQRVGSWLTHTQSTSTDPTTGVGAEL